MMRCQEIGNTSEFRTENIVVLVLCAILKQSHEFVWCGPPLSVNYLEMVNHDLVDVDRYKPPVTSMMTDVFVI